jgi:hypothetical protein
MSERSERTGWLSRLRDEGAGTRCLIASGRATSALRKLRVPAPSEQRLRAAREEAL